MIIFYRLKSESPNMRKISLMLEEIKLPHVVKFIEPHNSEKFDSEFVKISPSGTVPAIVDTDTGVTLFESGAILYYLAEKTQTLLPSNLRDRAEVIKWLMFEAANVCPTMIELHHYIMNDSGEFPDSLFQRYKSKIAQYCSILNAQLEDRLYLSGKYSIADIALFPWTVTLEDIADISLTDYPNLDNWAATISRRSTSKQADESDLAQSNWCYRSGGVEFCSAT